jgi:hypothetical protein
MALTHSSAVSERIAQRQAQPAAFKTPHHAPWRKHKAHFADP